MKTINTTTIRAEQFTYKKYFVFTVYENNTCFELWLTHTGYGVATLCFGIDKVCCPSVKTISAFIKLLENNSCIAEYVNDYKNQYMDD